MYLYSWVFEKKLILISEFFIQGNTLNATLNSVAVILV